MAGMPRFPDGDQVWPCQRCVSHLRRVWHHFRQRVFGGGCWRFAKRCSKDIVCARAFGYCGGRFIVHGHISDTQVNQRVGTAFAPIVGSPCVGLGCICCRAASKQQLVIRFPGFHDRVATHGLPTHGWPLHAFMRGYMEHCIFPIANICRMLRQHFIYVFVGHGAAGNVARPRGGWSCIGMEGNFRFCEICDDSCRRTRVLVLAFGI